MLHIWISVIFLLANANFIESLECYTCTDIDDVDNCQNSSRCIYGQSCFTDVRTNGQVHTYALGCTDNQQCGTITGSSPGIVGRGITERQTQECHECCSTDNCNNLLCNHLKPSTCIDDGKVDCAFMNAMFNICQDVHHSKTVCPKFCQLCNLVDGNWAQWSQWSSCDTTCGNGMQTRKRACTNPAPANNGLDCAGKDTDHKSCNKPLCPVHGGWTKWSGWGTCSKTCDVGIQKRIRNCTNPFPSRYGNHCFGDAVDDRLCMPGPCANGGWSDWGNWTSCSTSCGGGFRSKSRTCTNPRPSPLGGYCDGDPIEIESCNKQTCAHSVAFLVRDVDDLTPLVNQTIKFKNIIFNAGGAYNNNTGYFTAPLNGTYSFSVHICKYGSNMVDVAIVVDGKRYALDSLRDDSHYECGSVDSFAFLTRGQKVLVQCTHVHQKNTQVLYEEPNYFRNTFTGSLVN